MSINKPPSIFDVDEPQAYILKANSKSFEGCSSFTVLNNMHGTNAKNNSCFNFFKVFDELNLVDSFKNITSLSLPFCFFQDKPYGLTSKYTINSFIKIFPQLNISHLEIQGCYQRDNHRVAKDVSDVLHALKSDKLESLKLSEVTVLDGSCFSMMFQNCPMLTSLRIEHLRHSTKLFNFVSGLSKGLAHAPNLKFLQFIRTDITQFSERLLKSLKTNCKNLETLILVDHSMSSLIEKYPRQSLEGVQEMENLKFVYIRSPLLTNQMIQDLKKRTKAIAIVEKRPYLIGRFHKTVEIGSGIISDVTNLPMFYQRDVWRPNVDGFTPDISVSDFF